jgi:hypothetical protein
VNWALSRAEAGERRPGSLFGQEFTTTEVDDLRKSIVASRRLAPEAWLRERAPQEEFIDEKGYRLEPQCSTRIEGRESGMAGFRPKFLRALEPLQGGVKLPFQAGTDAPAGFQVIWKVRTHGQAPPRRTTLGPARERRTRSVVPHRADVVPEPALRRG